MSDFPLTLEPGIALTLLKVSIFVQLKASVADLEKQLAEYESALVEEMSVSQERKHQVERWQNQVANICSLVFFHTFFFLFIFRPSTCKMKVF